MALAGMLPLPPPAISQEGPCQLRAVPRGAACVGRPLYRQPGAGGQRWLWHRVSRSGREQQGSPVPAGRRWQRGSAARPRGALNPACGTVSRQPAVS